MSPSPSFRKCKWLIQALVWLVWCHLCQLHHHHPCWFLAASAVAVMFLTWAVHSIQISSKIWPQSVTSSSFGGSGHTDKCVSSLCLYSPSMVLKWWVQFSPMWFAWFDDSVSHIRLSCSTFLNMSFNSPPLIRPRAATDRTHQDHPVVESNMVHEQIPAVVRSIAVWA